MLKSKIKEVKDPGWDWFLNKTPIWFIIRVLSLKQSKTKIHIIFRSQSVEITRATVLSDREVQEQEAVFSVKR